MESKYKIFIAGIFMLLIFGGIKINNYFYNQESQKDLAVLQEKEKLTKNTALILQPSPPKPFVLQQPIPPALPPSPSTDFVCKSFDYTRWSLCTTDGTQSRVITAAYPNGCILTDALSVQQQKCQYTPLDTSFEDIVNKMVGQIHDAPDQTITTQYFAGHSDDVYITTNKWKLSSDGTTLFFEGTSKNRATEVITDHIILADTNKDFRPDMYSNNGDNWYNLANQDSDLVLNYTTVWAVASAYFGSYLLNY
ncbi:MAG: hypothetical protein Q8Q95_00705 [bacterium]|nr:hypothetical protein [bacterium]